MRQVVSCKSAGITLVDLTLPAAGEHLRDKDHKLEENKAPVIAREKKKTLEGSYFCIRPWKFCASPIETPGRFELPALYRDVLARDFVHPSSLDICYCPALLASERCWCNVESLRSLKLCLCFGILFLMMSATYLYSMYCY